MTRTLHVVALCECGCGEPAPIARSSNVSRGWIKGEPLRFRQGHGMRGRTWVDIYPAEVIERKHQQVATLGRRPKSSSTKRKLSEAKTMGYASGKYVPHNRGKRMSEAQKRKIAETRRIRYGTRASLNKKVRYTSKYKSWRTAVFQRDSYTCQRCGTSSKKARCRVYLHAHHRVPLDVLLRGLTFAKAMQCPSVWDISNGETLCVSCHRREPLGAYFG